MVWLVIWSLLIIRRVAVSLWAIRLLPLFFIAFYVIFLPFQPNQQTVVNIIEVVLDCIDSIWNQGVRLFFNDIILCFNPGCTLYNFFALLGAALINLVVDPIRDLLSKRFFFEGPDPPPSGEFAFDFFEEACEVIDLIFEFVLDTVQFFVDAIFQFIYFFYDQLIVEQNFNVEDLFFQFLNYLFRCILDIPCMKFDSAEAFGVSLVNCVCQFSPPFDDPPCDGEIEDADDIPAGLLCCIGLGCMLNDDGSFPSIPDELTENFFGNCVDFDLPDITTNGGISIGGVSIGGFRSVEKASSPRPRNEWIGKEDGQEGGFGRGGKRPRMGTLNKRAAVPDRLKKTSEAARRTLRKVKKEIVEPLSITQRLSHGISKTLYGANETQAKAEGQKAIQGLFDAFGEVFDQVAWDSELFDFRTPSYSEIYRTLYLAKTSDHMATLWNSFTGHMRSELAKHPRRELFVRFQTITSLVTWRILAPDKLDQRAEKLRSKGADYGLAVHHALETLRKVDPNFDNMTQILLKRNWDRGSVLRYHKQHPRHRSHGQHHQTIVDSHDVLNLLGLQAGATFNRTKMPLRIVSRGAFLEFHTVAPNTMGEHLYGATRSGITLASRVPWAAILIPILKNWQLFFAAIVPFVTSDYGILVINSYIQFFLDIFGDIYQEPLDIDLGDLLDIALEFLDITLNNLFIGLNKLTRLFLCWIWAFFLSGLMRLIPGVGLVFSMVFQSSSFFFSYCPPQPILVDNQPEQNPIEYLLDMLDCFGRPDVTQCEEDDDDCCVKVELSPPLMCTTKADCPGQPPCRCRDSAQYPSIFWSFVDDEPCPADSGFCMCWPLLPCGMQGDTEFFPPFRFPPFDLSSPFSKNCVDDFGYKVAGIIIYPWPPSLGDLLSTFKDLFDATYNNFLLGLKYVTRQISAGNLLSVSTWRFVIWIGVLVFIAGNYLTGIVIVGILTFIAFGLPVISELIIEETLPFLESLGSLGDKILDFIRFPNFSDAELLGHPVSGENVCWIMNLPTLIGAAGILYFFFLVLYHFIVVGALFGIFYFIVETIAIPFRVFFACVWYNNRIEAVESMKQSILTQGVAMQRATRELRGLPPKQEGRLLRMKAS